MPPHSCCGRVLQVPVLAWLEQAEPFFPSVSYFRFHIKTTVSLNTIMIDGTGMCGGCRISVGGKTKFVCVDGPEFDGHQVDWDLMIHRMGAFKPIEAKAREHVCNLYKGI